jgi:hypothetical protein
MSPLKKLYLKEPWPMKGAAKILVIVAVLIPMAASRRFVVEQRLEIPQGNRLRSVADGSRYREYAAGCAGVGASVAGEFQLFQRYQGGWFGFSAGCGRRQDAAQVSLREIRSAKPDRAAVGARAANHRRREERQDLRLLRQSRCTGRRRRPRYLRCATGAGAVFPREPPACQWTRRPTRTTLPRPPRY